jgi:hypothetical protein
MARAICRAQDGWPVVAGDGSNATSPSVGILAKVNHWQRTFGGRYSRSLRAVTELSDGNLAAGGFAFRSGTAGDENFWVLKVDPKGSVLWEREFGGADEQTDVNAIAPAPDGGVLVAGLKLPHAQGPIAFTWLIRLASNGAMVWDKVFTEGVALALCAAPDGSGVIFGAKQIPGSLESYLWALAFNAKGEKVWSRVYEDARVYAMIAAGAAQTSDGGYVVTGRLFARKLDSKGNPVWSREFPNGDLCAAAAQTDGSVLVAGANIDYYGTTEAYVAGVSADGKNLLWDNCDMAGGGFAAAVLAGDANNALVAASLPTTKMNTDIVVCDLYPQAEARKLAAVAVTREATFLDLLNQADAIVKKQYPAAQLYEADLDINKPGSPWRFVFNERPDGHGTVLLYCAMGQFQLPPTYIPQPWLEDVVIRLPISLDLAEAQALAEKAGYTGQITNIVLRHPLYPGVIEPSYIFTMPSRGVWVFVGVKSRKVTTEPFAKA